MKIVEFRWRLWYFVTHQNSDLFSVVYYSLVNNQSKFVKLCIDETQFDLKEFLSQSMLVKLYNEVRNFNSNTPGENWLDG